MEHDYYQILGIPPTADDAAIRRAYRGRAMKCHPDRGGSHDEMVLLNEAWEVLSDPELRQRYDEARAGVAAARSAAAEDARQAHRRAEQYPRRWADMEAVLNRVAADFADARHGSQQVGGLDVYFPVVDSASGWLFILSGAALGGFLLSGALWDFCDRNAIKFVPLRAALIGGPILAGAWAGAWLHMAVGNALRGGPREPPATTSGPAEPVVVACRRCGQKLRLPALGEALQVTCPSCRHSFPHIPRRS